MIAATAKHVRKSKPGRKTKTWSIQAQRDAIKLRNTLKRTVQSNGEAYLRARGEVRRLSEEWEEFLVDLEDNPDLGRALSQIKSAAGSPHSSAFCEPPIYTGRTFLKSTGKSNAFVQQYAGVNGLLFDKTERFQARHLKKALQLPAAAESCCSPFTICERETAMYTIRN